MRGAWPGAGAALAVACSAPTQRPPRSSVPLIEWKPTPTERAATIALAAPGPDRVALPGATFTMGSTEADLKAAVLLCRREPAPEYCDTSDLAMALNRYIPTLLRLELHAHTVTLSPFAIDRVEVSVAAYERCVVVGACARPDFRTGDRRYDAPELPVTHVLWQDAAAYCAWQGGRLPREAEWEYAARGKTGRAFPWGYQYAPRRANHGVLSTLPGAPDETDGAAGLAPVESYADGATPEGIKNLAGNVAEWVSDLVDRNMDGTVGYDKGPVTNPRGAQSGEHLTRGGSFRTGAIFLRAAMRSVRPGQPYADDIGFRCAYDR